MIEYLKGILIKKAPTHLVIDVNGVGYGVNVSLRTSDSMSDIGKPVELTTFLYVKEDIMELFGFSSNRERDVFFKLISVSGIGPKMGLRILSERSPDELISQIVEGNVTQLLALKGIGKKTAEVMIASLKAPLSKFKLQDSADTSGSSTSNKITDNAILALVALGVKEAAAQTSVKKAFDKLGKKVGTSQLIAEALKLV
jgi:Holliday junction DNA helicase RuvA